MKSARRFSTPLLRWTSLCVCFALVVVSLAIPRASLAFKSTRPQQQGPRNDNTRRVPAPAPQPGAPFPNLPNLD